MSSGDRDKPLWAGSLAEQVQPGQDDVIVRVLEEEELEAASTPREQAPRRERAGRGPLGAALVAAVAVAAFASAEADPASLTIQDVPSGWGDVPMRCDTVRFGGDERALETFTCRAIGGRPLPHGLFESPESQWTSDITRIEARENRIRISRDGVVEGWATY